MAEIKTKKTAASVAAFIDGVPDPKKRADTKKLLALFKKVTKQKPVMWGTSMIGFGTYHYKSERSAQEGDWPRTAFSPRKQNLTLYIMPGFKDMDSLLKKLGPHKTSVGCLYLKSLEKIDMSVLEKIVAAGVKEMNRRYPK